VHGKGLAHASRQIVAGDHVLVVRRRRCNTAQSSSAGTIFIGLSSRSGRWIKSAAGQRVEPNPSCLGDEARQLVGHGRGVALRFECTHCTLESRWSCRRKFFAPFDHLLLVEAEVIGKSLPLLSPDCQICRTERRQRSQIRFRWRERRQVTPSKRRSPVPTGGARPHCLGFTGSRSF